MPDVDIVHDKVTRKFKRAYEKLCKGDLSPEELSDVIARGLRNTLKYEGRVPCELIFKALARAFSAVDFGKPLDVDSACRLMDHFARASGARSRYLAIAIDAFRAGLMQAENLHDIDAVKKSVANECVRRTLEADFLDRMPLTGHLFDASADDIERRLQEMRVHFEAELERYVRHIAQRATTKGLRKKPRKRGPKPDFGNIDLSSLDDEDPGGS